MELFLHTILCYKNFISQVKRPSSFSMLKTAACYIKTKNKNVKVTKMVEFIKTCDQIPRRFNFGTFFISIIVCPPFGKNRSSENAVQEEQVISFFVWGNDKNLWESFA